MSLYAAFGLTFDSEIELPELPLTSGVADVSIRRGRISRTECRITPDEEYVRNDESGSFRIVRGREILTPPLTSGCLPGITREALLEIIPVAGYSLKEQDLVPQDLDSADEVFISSTTREVAGVGSIQPNWKFPSPGKVTAELAVLFQKYVQAHLHGISVPHA